VNRGGIGGDLEGFSLQDGIVTSSHIGSLQAIKSLSESHYDPDTITRTELDLYRYQVQGYRDVWRSALDPLGIVLNREGDGISVDFFMTPIPVLEAEMQDILTFFEKTAKEELDFVKNPKIRTGIFSFAIGMDRQKTQSLLPSYPGTQEGIRSFEGRVLGGKSIWEYLGGEFAFTLGSLNADIFDGWNAQWIDLNLLVQVTNEEK